MKTNHVTPSNQNSAALPDIPAKAVQFLVVDDHAFIRGIVCQHLRSCGIERFAYSNSGGEAIQLLKKVSLAKRNDTLIGTTGSRPDAAGGLFLEKNDFKSAHAYCVITDFGMPGVNGLQVMKAIRCGETNLPRNTPIILLTGFSDDYVVSAALALDVNAFVLKPVSRNTLWEKVERVLKSESPVKDAGVYAAVEIPDEDGAIIDGPGAPKPKNAEIMSDDADNATRWIPMGTVQPGSELAADLYGDRGLLLLRQGTIFSEGMLQKLKDVALMRAFGGKVPIKNELTA